MASRGRFVTFNLIFRPSGDAAQIDRRPVNWARSVRRDLSVLIQDRSSAMRHFVIDVTEKCRSRRLQFGVA
jgi:hypothetical protein